MLGIEPLGLLREKQVCYLCAMQPQGSNNSLVTFDYNFVVLEAIGCLL